MLGEFTESTMYTILKAKLSKKYPTLSYTTSDKNDVQPKLPNLFFNQMDASSTGEDLEGKKQNAITSVIQIDISSSTSLNEVKKIMDYAGDIMIGKGYRLISGPELATTSVYRMVARFRRVVADGDNLQGF